MRLVSKPPRVSPSNTFASLSPFNSILLTLYSAGGGAYPAVVTPTVANFNTVTRDTAPTMASEQLRVLIVGNGGREHALAWKLSESPLVDIVYVAPGNGGTGLGASSKITNANVKGDDYPGLVAFAQENKVNLVVPGPEAPLVDGIQGYFQAGKCIQCYLPPSDTARTE